MDIHQAIMARVSTRTFKAQAFSPKRVERIKEILKEASRHTLFKTPVSFDYLSVEEAGYRTKKIGTYGMFRGHQGFVYGLCQNSKEGYLDFSYAMEHIVLALTKEEIATCWVAGTFNRKQFYKAMAETDPGVLPAIVPIGVASEKLRLYEKLMKKVAKPRNRLAFDQLFFEGDFKTPLKAQSVFYKALQMVRLGPSAVNKQPWRAVVMGKQCHLYLYNTALSTYPYTSLDMGIAAYHLSQSLLEDGYKGEFVQSEPMAMRAIEGMHYGCTFQLE